MRPPVISDPLGSYIVYHSSLAGANSTCNGQIGLFASAPRLLCSLRAWWSRGATPSRRAVTASSRQSSGPRVDVRATSAGSERSRQRVRWVRSGFFMESGEWKRESGEWIEAGQGLESYSAPRNSNWFCSSSAEKRFSRFSIRRSQALTAECPTRMMIPQCSRPASTHVACTPGLY